ncbi:MAG: hypothetical protein H7A35_00770 [Planctomycetales bacterium]|nr:hypothetical protein [bacterium]UNM08594.1 MAG: hypothetical protein H7A35_00770 [Planctomycetales bacterium]
MKRNAIMIAVSVLCAVLLASGCDKASKAGESADSNTPQTIPASEQHGSAASSEGHEHADADGHHMDMHGDMDHGTDVTKSTSPAVGSPYALASCPVSGEELGSMGDPIHYNYQGRDIEFCCQSCVPKFEADPAKYIAEIDARMIEQQMADYPLDSCPVTGDKLGAEGETVDIIFDNRLVRFCCADCVKDFKADPAKYLSKIDEALIASQSASYPLDKCVVTGDALGEDGDRINYVVGSTLIELCCEDCKHDVAANPAKYLEMVHKARGDQA